MNIGIWEQNIIQINIFQHMGIFCVFNVHMGTNIGEINIWDIFNSKIFPYNKYMGSLSNSSHMTLKRSHINLKMLYGTFYPTYGMILRYKVPICIYFFQILFPYDANSPIYVLYGTNLDKIWYLSFYSVVIYYHLQRVLVFDTGDWW